MSHPFQSVRQNVVQHARVGSITKHYATGGAVHDDVAEDKKLIKQAVKKSALRMDGGAVKSRPDKPSRASGGRVKPTTVNVIVAPSPPASPTIGPQPGGPSPIPRPPAPPPSPAMAAGPMPGPGGPPPGGPPPGVMRARGGMVKSDQATAGIGRGRTKLVHDDQKWKEQQNLNRKAAITKKTGGAITSEGGKAKMAPHAPKGGAGGGLARIDKQNHPGKYGC